MAEHIMVACDLHDKTMLVTVAQGRERAETFSVRNTRAGRIRLIQRLQERSQAGGGARVIFAYEASGQGFGLFDELTAAGIECHVLAPTRIARSPQHARRKTDEQDAEVILQLLRGHVLAGNPLPTVWIPDPQTRDDRELVRARLDVADKLGSLKTQIKGLLKRNRLVRPESIGTDWNRHYWAWLSELTRQEAVGLGTRAALATLMRQLRAIEKEIQLLEQQLERLAFSARYAAPLAAVQSIKGVGLLTGLVFLTEIGDLRRFANRRQISSYLGLVPTSHETGQRSDRKGHITRHGPSRVRSVLCQATWSLVRRGGLEMATYQRIVRKNPKHKKIAVVAVMRRLAVRMWHLGCQESPLETPWGWGRQRVGPAPVSERLAPTRPAGSRN